MAGISSPGSGSLIKVLEVLDEFVQGELAVSLPGGFQNDDSFFHEKEVKYALQKLQWVSPACLIIQNGVLTFGQTQQNR